MKFLKSVNQWVQAVHQRIFRPLIEAPLHNEASQTKYNMQELQPLHDVSFGP